MSDTLLDLSRELDDIYRSALESGGELSDEQAARLDQAGTALALKVDSMALYLADLEARAEALKVFAKAVAAKAKAAESLRERLLGYCALALGDKPEIKGEHLTMKWVKNPPSVEITDEEALRRTLPDAFEKVVTWKIQKATVKAALSKGEPVEGASIKQTQRVEIR